MPFSDYFARIITIDSGINGRLDFDATGTATNLLSKFPFSTVFHAVIISDEFLQFRLDLPHEVLGRSKLGGKLLLLAEAGTGGRQRRPGGLQLLEVDFGESGNETKYVSKALQT